MIQDPRDPDRKWVRVADMKAKTYNNVKGNFGEAMADHDAAKRGWEKLNGPPKVVGDKIGKGIDAVYTNPEPPPPYIIADAKYDKSTLGTTKEGVEQMSDQWIRERLENEVGEDLAQEIIRDGYKRVIQRISPGGDVSIEIMERSGVSGKSWR